MESANSAIWDSCDKTPWSVAKCMYSCAQGRFRYTGTWEYWDGDKNMWIKDVHLRKLKTYMTIELYGIVLNRASYWQSKYQADAQQDNCRIVRLLEVCMSLQRRTLVTAIIREAREFFVADDY